MPGEERCRAEGEANEQSNQGSIHEALDDRPNR